MLREFRDPLFDGVVIGLEVAGRVLRYLWARYWWEHAWQYRYGDAGKWSQRCSRSNAFYMARLHSGGQVRFNPEPKPKKPANPKVRESIFWEGWWE